MILKYILNQSSKRKFEEKRKKIERQPMKIILLIALFINKVKKCNEQMRIVSLWTFSDSFEREELVDLLTKWVKSILKNSTNGRQPVSKIPILNLPFEWWIQFGILLESSAVCHLIMWACRSLHSLSVFWINTICKVV